MKKNIVSSPSTSLFKLYPSLNNMFMLGIVLFSVFLIYRYVKSLEKEVKILADKINTLQYKPSQPIMVNENNVCDPLTNVCMMKSSDDDDDYDDDDESVKSEDIMKLINEIQNNDNQEQSNANEKTKEEEHEETNIESLPTIVELSSSVEENENSLEEDDDIVLKKTKSESSVLDEEGLFTEESLLKKTNDELRKILKEQGKNTKGLKNDLIKRILEE